MNRITAAQAIALADLVRRYNNARVDLFVNQFDLPEGYVAVNLSSSVDAPLISAVISPDGEVSS